MALPSVDKDRFPPFNASPNDMEATARSWEAGAGLAGSTETFCEESEKSRDLKEEGPARQRQPGVQGGFSLQKHLLRALGNG